MNREPGAGSREPSREPAQTAITAAFQAYADRGVFRGFRATPAARGRIEYRFLWLTRAPMTAVFDAPRRRLQFPSLLPGITSDAAADLQAIVTSRPRKDQPPHKRLDRRRARLAAVVRKGGLSLSVEIRGANHGYAVKMALNVINELFVALHEAHPEYLVEHFGISTE